eukprot:GHVH01011816.1.p1 GENE.GHVH01011816.1~~GHVH01011816.1.p1  ORF type:complete len:334 (-),score=40.23 GHVH01011816.1:360-1361(-)
MGIKQAMKEIDTVDGTKLWNLLSRRGGLYASSHIFFHDANRSITGDDLVPESSFLGLEQPTDVDATPESYSLGTPNPLPVHDRKEPHWATQLPDNLASFWSGSDERLHLSRIDALDLVLILSTVTDSEAVNVIESYQNAFKKSVYRKNRMAKFFRVPLSSLLSIVSFCPSFFAMPPKFTIQFPSILSGSIHTLSHPPLLLSNIMPGILITTSKCICPDISETFKASTLHAVLDVTPKGLFDSMTSCGVDIPTVISASYSPSAPPPRNTACFIDGYLYCWIPLRRHSDGEKSKVTNFILTDELTACLEFLLFGSYVPLNCHLILSGRAPTTIAE